MIIVLGFVVVFGSIYVGYTMHGGQPGVLMQVSEYIIIGGAALGAAVIGNKPSVVKRMLAESFAPLKPNPMHTAAFSELLQVLYEIFYTARRDGLVGIEAPETSELFNRYPGFLKQHHAVSFLADTMKVMLTGAVEDHHLSEILELDLDQHHEESMVVPNAVTRVADALPGFGIVAAVLGVIITMGKIGGDAAAIGILLARGGPPITSVEFARRSLEPEYRPSFAELEELTRRGRPVRQPLSQSPRRPSLSMSSISRS